ncbi:nucleotide-diphospho-sugar transferase [Saitoella complicata NRRL Y-17804]|nr:nucleotide-diphospho-sugar transferase [Saitoella complicata NRRL Y-17804]ODQ53967.1 nucleotide-diphospho-sugar transferase [Saitoella complicata NRRL Y-17804]
MMFAARPKFLVIAAAVFTSFCLLLYTLSGTTSIAAFEDKAIDATHYGQEVVTGAISDGAEAVEDVVEDVVVKPKNRRRAIVSSVQTDSFAPLAMAMGYSLKKSNDLDAQDVDMLLLVREGAVNATNIAKLEQVGWQVRKMQDLVFEGVNYDDIRPWHRYNLNKLIIWQWEEYERIIFADADMLIKGDIGELWDMPGDFAATPDSWPENLQDTRFNSGFILIRPSKVEYETLAEKVSDKKYHRPDEADQAFLNVYWRFRAYMLPYAYNFNLVLFRFHREVWDNLWPEAKVIHFTTRKPSTKDKCATNPDCLERPVLEWYSWMFQSMVEEYGWKDMPIHE